MPTLIPGSKPRLSATALNARIGPLGVDRTKHPVVIVGLRGYYKNSMGAPGVNDRGIYDDAIFIDTPSGTIAYNGNTDPSRYRKGRRRGAGKGMASLKPGVWYAHRFGKHRRQYLALCQLAGDVTVIRDGDPPYEDTGRFGINIHRGSHDGTASLGCQTIHPDQWPSFINTAVDQVKRYFAERWNRETIPYILLED
jgi:hypothetical protein